MIPGLGRSPGEGQGNPLQYSFLENPQGQRRLAGYSPRSSKELDMIEVTKHVQQSRNLQSILSFGSWPVKPKIFKVLRRKWQPTPVFLPENSTDRGAWWARVHGVEKSWTRLSYFHSLIQGLEGDIILSAYLVKERFWNTDLPFHLRS